MYNKKKNSHKNMTPESAWLRYVNIPVEDFLLLCAELTDDESPDVYTMTVPEMCRRYALKVIPGLKRKPCSVEELEHIAQMLAEYCHTFFEEISKDEPSHECTEEELELLNAIFNPYDKQNPT